MTLYIYRVGWTYPGRNPFTRSKSMKITSCIRTLLGPVRPTSQTGRLLPNRLHRQRPVRPPGATGQTGWSSLLPILVINTSLFFKIYSDYILVLLYKNEYFHILHTLSYIQPITIIDVLPYVLFVRSHTSYIMA